MNRTTGRLLSGCLLSGCRFNAIGWTTICWATLSIIVWLATPETVASAQAITYAQTGSPPEMGLELLQEEPHDIIYFTEKAKGGWVKARLLPVREMPGTPNGSLKYNIVGIETEDFATKWNEIERIDFWEKRLERETAEKIAAGDFAGAYPFLSILIRDYPTRPGLRELRSDFLWNNAIQRAKNGQRAESLAMLEELRRYAPDYKRSTVVGAIGATTNSLMTAMVQEGKLAEAQQLLARLRGEYSNVRLASVETWTKEFLRMAEEKRDAALLALKEERFRDARLFARESVYLTPDIPGGKELIERIDTIYPLINVGVLQSATVFDPIRLDNWASRRAGRLLYRTLFEMQSAGPEGGQYNFIFGDTEISADQQTLDLNLELAKLPDPLNKIESHFLADRLAKRATPGSDEYFSPWAAAVSGIGIDGASQIRCVLRRPNVLPTCLMQINVDGSWFGGKPGSTTGDYRLDITEGNLTRFVLADKALEKVGKDNTKPREIVEVRCGSGSEAVSKLLSGEIDMLDQLFPADAIRLKRSRDIAVATYPLPTIHMLVPCSDHPFVAESNFRRALVYATNREDILKGELLEGKEIPGCQVVSGPFPAGIDFDDPLGYAYDTSIVARRYEPSLAQLLVELNRSLMENEAKRKGDTVPKMTPIRLAFPADNLSRVACEAIRAQWELIGLPVELVQLPIGRSYPDPDTADIVYVSAAVWEPILDARRLLGPSGLARSENQMIGLGLRRLEEARNWKEVRDRLLVLHDIAHHELPIIPLWQMIDSYAYRKDLTGVGTGIVSLYQNAENWRRD
ncbi:ABC transporter substrate-binding protein [Stieleria varia]